MLWYKINSDHGFLLCKFHEFIIYTMAKMVTTFKNVIPCFWQKYSWKLIWIDLNLMLLTNLILKSFKKKRKESSSCHALLWSCFAILCPCHASPDKICIKDKNFQFYNWFPTFWRQKGEIYHSVTIHLLLFTVTIHPLLFMTMFTHYFCLFKGGCPLYLEQV